jgi:hypothetical protein
VSVKQHYKIVSDGAMIEFEKMLNDAYAEGYRIIHVVTRGETPGHIVAILELTTDLS